MHKAKPSTPAAVCQTSETTASEADQQADRSADQYADEDPHRGRTYRVSSHRNRATGKVRYVEGSMTEKGCRFL